MPSNNPAVKGASVFRLRAGCFPGASCSGTVAYTLSSGGTGVRYEASDTNSAVAAVPGVVGASPPFVTDLGVRVSFVTIGDQAPAWEASVLAHRFKLAEFARALDAIA